MANRPPSNRESVWDCKLEPEQQLCDLWNRGFAMHPLEYELHLEQVWNYLMLDAARVLQHQLCIPGDLAKLQRWARVVFEHHYRTNDLNLESGLLISSLTRQLRS